jgi:peptidoglycan/xylan/chitin deacetylase (PgdA/CDA1 family)
MKNLATFNKLNIFKFMLFALCLCFLSIGKAQDITKNINTHSFVILQYHHVSTDTPNSTSVSPATFEKHMAFLDENYHIIDLAEAITKIKSGQALPNKSVAITFDDGFSNILENGHPILKKYKFPYTIFINSALIGESYSQLTWDQVRSMQPLATFANHTLDHAHLLVRNENEKLDSWLTRVMNDINQSEQIIKDQLGYSKKWLAYPFGEFNHALKTELLAQGYIGFGQQSGAVAIFSDFGALPRFPAAGVYANLDSLKTKLNSFAMPVSSVKPIDNEFKVGDTLDKIELVIDGEDVRLAGAACYFKGNKLPVKIVSNTLSVTVDHKPQPGRARINCTAPSQGFSNRFYWYSFPMFTATKDGDFLD